MQDNSYPFPVYSGLFEPQHYKHINAAIWLFLWCVSSTTREVDVDGVRWGLVLGNKPVKVEELAEQFGVSCSTIKRWIEKLEEQHYIKTKRAPYGLIFSVKNSKKFTSKNELSNKSDSSNMNQLSTSDGSKVIHLVSKNELSNKDITEDVVVIVDPDEIISRAMKVEQHYIMRRGKGLFISPADFDEMKKLVATGIPLEIVFKAIDLSFAEYKPKFRNDQIRSFNYCVPRCYSEWERSKVDKSITGAVPHVPVAIETKHRNRQQQAFDVLDQIAEE